MTESYAIPTTETGPDAPTVETAETEQVEAEQTEEVSEQEETAEVAEPQTPERPAWLPSKFKSPEQMAAAYAALERRMGQQPKPTAPAAEGEEVTPEETAAAPVLAPEFLQGLYDEWSTYGVLSDQSYDELAAKGIDRPTVDAYIAGQQAQAERNAETVYAVVGGKDSYAQLGDAVRAAVEAGEVDRAEVEAFNALLDQGDLPSAKLALRGLASAVGFGKAKAKPKQIAGNRHPSTGAQPFESWQQFQEAMRDPRYAKGDTAYHAEVAKRLENSPHIDPTRRQ